MTTMKARFYTQGRFSRYPGRQAIINAIKNGERPRLKCQYDEDGQIILVNPDTNESTGCIPPNPSFGENYDILAACIDLNLDMEVVAIATNGKDKHYIVEITVPITEKA